MKKIKNGTHSTTRYIAVDGIYRYTLRDNQDTLGFRESLWYLYGTEHRTSHIADIVF